MNAVVSLLRVAPLTLPALILAVPLSFLVSRWLSSSTGVSRLLAFALMMALGVVLAATLTPRAETGWSGHVLMLDLERLSFERLTGVNETSLNVLLFVPLAFLATLIDSRHLRRRVLLGVWLCPLAVELVQAVFPGLGRIGFVLSDALANMLGVAIGVTIGVTVRRLRDWGQAGSA